MELTKKRLRIEEITKVKYNKDAIIVYTKEKVYICAVDSEKYLPNGIVEYTLKKLNTHKGEQNG